MRYRKIGWVLRRPCWNRLKDFFAELIEVRFRLHIIYEEISAKLPSHDPRLRRLLKVPTVSSDRPVILQLCVKR